MDRLLKLLKNKKLLFAVLAVIIITVVFVVFKLTKNDFSVNNGKSGEKIVLEDKDAAKSGITGQRCENANVRPIAVMLSSDPEARPLSGIGQADLVFEMPVVGDNTVTRMMVVFQCAKPERIGSVRSARLDFIPLVQGLDAIYAHFGGEHTALAELNNGVTNNIDGLKYDGTTYYRTSAPRPHNSFSSYALLMGTAKTLGYSLTAKISELFKHDAVKTSDVPLDVGRLVPPTMYQGDFLVAWTFNAERNQYSRMRAGRPEVDKNTGMQVTVSNLVVMHTTSEIINKDYNRVKTVGSGKAELYKNGRRIDGTWEKASDTARLIFKDTKGAELSFTPGQILIEIVTK